jgi:integrase
MARRGWNQGTIFRRSNGSWMAQVSIDGKRVSHKAKTQGECHAWVRQTLDQIDQGMTFEGQKVTLSSYLREWIAVKKTALRPKTAFEYDRLINRLIEPHLGKVPLKDLTLHRVSVFYERLAAQGVGLANIRYAHRVLHCALEQAARMGMISRNPAHGATLPKRPYREMKTLNEAQVTSLLVAVSKSRFRALFHLAVTTGMRFSELRGLTWSDVDWIKGTITVKRQINQLPRQGPTVGAPKTHSGVRIIRLGSTALDMLREQQQRLEQERLWAGHAWRENDLIFPSKVGTPFVPVSVQVDFRNGLEAAGLPHIRFHDLRHTAASLMLSHGVPALVVSKILGHSSPSITLGIYAHASLDMQDQAASVMDDIVAPVAVVMPKLQQIATRRVPEALKLPRRNENTA